MTSMYFARSRRCRALVASCAASLVLAACQEAAAPRASTFDEARVKSGTAAIQSAAQSPALAAMQQLVRLNGGAALSLSPAAALGDELAQSSARIARGALDAGTTLLPVLGSQLLGKTLTYDTAKKSYLVSTRGGAPANGVRFVLYDEAANGDPIVGKEVGYADLTDEKRSSPTALGVKLVVVTEGTTRVSYAFDVTPTPPTSFNVQGFIADGASRLDFTVNATGPARDGGFATVQSTLRVPAENFAVRTTLKGTPEGGNGEIDMTLESATDRIVVDATVAAAKLDATFSVNGALFARATGSLEQPVITGADGRALTAEELEALQRIVTMAEDVTALIERLVEPAARLLLLALGLGGW